MHDVTAVTWFALLVLQWITFQPVESKLHFYISILGTAVSIGGILFIVALSQLTFIMEV